MVPISTTLLVQLLGIFLVFLTLTSGFNLDYKDCNSKGAAIESLNISQCYSNPCSLRHKVVYSVRITFKANENTTRLQNKVFVLAIGREFAYPSVKEDACSGMACPVVKGERKTVVANFTVHPRIPRMGIRVKWTLRDDQNKNFVCLIVPFKIR